MAGFWILASSSRRTGRDFPQLQVEEWKPGCSGPWAHVSRVVRWHPEVRRSRREPSELLMEALALRSGWLPGAWTLTSGPGQSVEGFSGGIRMKFCMNTGVGKGTFPDFSKGSSQHREETQPHLSQEPWGM